MSTTRLFAWPFCLALAACATSGGGAMNPFTPPGAPGPTAPGPSAPGPTAPGPTVTVPPLTPFTDWASVQNGGYVALDGASREATWTKVPGGDGIEITGTVTSVGAPSPFAEGAMMVQRVGNGARITEVQLRTAGGTIETFNFGTIPGLVIDHWWDARLDYVGELDGGVYNGLVPDVFSLNWNYQSFGVWSTGQLPGLVSRIGVMTAGIQSSAVNMPTTGGAIYKGVAAGNYVTDVGYPQPVSANATVYLDFATRSVGLYLTESMVLPYTWTAPTPRPDLNLYGTLTYAPGASSFAGSVSTAGGIDNAPMSGTANGMFYGPGAAELGGVFWVNGTQPFTYAGAFGAAK